MTINNALAELKGTMIARGLRACRLFTGLNPEDLQQVADIVSVRRIERDEYVFREGQPSKGFFVVHQGAISIHRVNAAGREQVLHVFRAGESFAEATLSMEAGYPADARAVESSQVLMIPRQAFLELLRRRPELAVRLLVGMSLRLRTLVGQLEDMTLHQVEHRLANWLLKRCPDPASPKPVTIELTTTKRALAAELGTVSETLSRTLAKMRDLNLLHTRGKTLTIENPIRLKTYLEERDV
ncbi:MAG: Crp/Fnr family transcriptional regulator [Verrucomicrobia bacterium]|jgi:CRP/FNR family transcriptional regulator|nr:Crp/Fnr family transcriptional regulator [Verrucomicrobiota bacterium]